MKKKIVSSFHRLQAVKLPRRSASWRLRHRCCGPVTKFVLIDSTITPDYKKRVLEETRDALCLGISLVTGPMIRETVEIARALKEWSPDFPIILGGWHPSLVANSDAGSPFH